MDILKHLYLAPIWLLELLSSAKSFQSNPILGSSLLNRLGLHVFRLLLSHTIMRLRMKSLSWGLPKEDRQFYLKQGYLLKENFLSPDEHTSLRTELFAYQGETRESHQGNTITQRAALAPSVSEKTPELKALFSSPQFKRLCRFTAGHIRPPLFYLETIKNNKLEKGTDPQRSFHSDTFHPTMKCWYFPDEVEAKHGPFTYIPGSHRLTLRRLKWEYQQSIKATSLDNTLSRRGSFRFSKEDIQALDLAEPVSFTVKPNTLLFANTFGIHRRGDSEGKNTRVAIWGDSRTNPFLPFPGITNRWINEFQYSLLDLYRQNIDRKAANAGRTSTWRVISKK